VTQPTARRVMRCVVALAAVVVVGLGPALPTAAVDGSASTPSTASAAQGSSSVMIMDDTYQPASLTVTVGDTVTWTNHDQARHHVAGASGPEALQAPVLSQGQSWSHTFGAAGSYSYFCSVHPDMAASLTVNPAPTPTTEAGTSGDDASSPDEVASAPTGTTVSTNLPPMAVAGVVLAIALGTTLALVGGGTAGAVAPAAAGAGGSGANSHSDRRSSGATEADDTAVMPAAIDGGGATGTVEPDETEIEEAPVTATDALAQLAEPDTRTTELE
jgi:plastocyanin